MVVYNTVLAEIYNVVIISILEMATSSSYSGRYRGVGDGGWGV